MKIFVGLTFLFLGAYLAIAAYLYVFQREFLYFPTPQYDHVFERLTIESEGENIELIVLNQGNKKALLYFGGNAESVVANAEAFSSYFPEVTIYLVNYRAYGGSSGKPSEAGLFADALRIYDEINTFHSNIGVAGRSLGSGVATYLAANRPIEALALITPFDSVLNLAKAQFNLFPVKLLLKDAYNSISRAKDIESKVFVITAENDQVVPISHTTRLINEFSEGQVELRVIQDAGHNSISNTAQYYKALGDYLSMLIN